MKLISIRQPWASLIINGGRNRKGKIVHKDIENRSWPCSYRDTLGIHASQTKTGLKDLLQYVADNFDITVDENELVFGAVIGSVKMTDCVFGSLPSVWFEGDYGFVLKDPLAYPKPIPSKGQLRLYERPEIAKTLARYERLRLGGSRKA